jgi:hypothetical protein
MSVDIRLCGSIPRQDVLQHGARSSPTALQSRTATLSVNCLAVLNSESSTHRTITGYMEDTCEHGTTSLAQDKSDVMPPYDKQPFCPLFEPPMWAVPARGETRLEVRSHCG